MPRLTTASLDGARRLPMKLARVSVAAASDMSVEIPLRFLRYFKATTPDAHDI